MKITRDQILHHPTADPTGLIDFTEVAWIHAELGLTTHTHIALVIALQAVKLRARHQTHCECKILSLLSYVI